MLIEPYNRKQKKYHCGKKLLKVEKDKKIKHIVLVIDLQSAYCARIYEDGSIEKIFDITSSVRNKHRQGGQSQRRFERIREGSIIEWFKRLNEKLKDVKGNIYVGISFVYKERFKKYLSLENANKIINYDRIEYTGLCGIYQYKSKLEKKE